MAACSMMMRRDDERMRAQPPDDDDHEHDASCWMSLSDLVEDATTNEGDRCACGLLGTASSAAARVRATGSAASEGAREGASEAGQVLLEPTEALREARRDAPALAPGVAPFGASAAAASLPCCGRPAGRACPERLQLLALLLQERLDHLHSDGTPSCKKKLKISARVATRGSARGDGRWRVRACAPREEGGARAEQAIARGGSSEGVRARGARGTREQCE
mmetsp:Transcript_6637/g.19395  ORF Transcript_6637/g.19395 Transcript_6637/m.19395 type:complete len:221 (-) Transcript_6637:448-1110(-)